MPSQRRNRKKKANNNDPFKRKQAAAIKMGCDERAVNLAIDENELNDLIVARLNADVQRIESRVIEKKRLERVVSASQLPPSQGPIIVVTGPPAGGKGTQCKLLAERFGLIHLGVGDLVRDHMARGTGFGIMAGEYVSAGRFVPDALVIKFMRDQLRRDDVLRTGCVLDGFPRTGEQAAAVLQWLDMKKFILFELPEDEIVDRALNRRMDPVTGKIYNLKTNPPPAAARDRLVTRQNDASEQIVRGRIRKYNMELAPIVDQVNAQAPGKLCRISAMQSIEQVHIQLCQELGLGAPTVPGASAEAADDDGWGAADDDGWGAAPEAAAEMAIDLQVGPSTTHVNNGSAFDTNVAISIPIPDLQDREPADICCVVDISGSMDQMATYEGEDGQQKNDGLTYLDIVKHAVKAVIRTLGPGDRFSLVQFDNRADIVYDLANMTDDKVEAAVNATECLHTRGSTDIWAGLLAGMEALRMGDPTGSSTEARSRAVLILTDGCPNNGPKTSAEFLPEIRKYKDQHPGLSFQVNTFGFGYNLISDLLVDIAKEGNGTFAFCPDALIVGTVFVNTIANVLSTWNQNAKLHLTEMNGSKFTGDVLGGHSVAETSWGRVVSLGPLTLGQTHDIVVPMNLPKGTAAYLDVVLEYTKSDGSMVRVPFEGVSRTGSMHAMVTGLRSEAVSIGWEAVADKTGQHCDRAMAKMQAMTDKIENTAGLGDTGKALFADVGGRMTKGLTGRDRYNRWGKHYLRAIVRAHQVQVCTNFMDPGLQVYGGTVFKALVQKGTAVFTGMGAPTPSRAAQATRNNYSSSSSSAPSAPAASTYMDSSGG